MLVLILMEISVIEAEFCDAFESLDYIRSQRGMILHNLTVRSIC
jgi:hypothetical protein